MVLGLTATQMYERFLLRANSANTLDLRSWVVADWLNQAQAQMFNALLYPEWDKQGENPPPVAYQKDFKFAEDLAPFVVALPTPSSAVIPRTNNKGFWPFPTSPAALVRLTTVAVITDGCDGQPEWCRVEYLRDMGIGSTLGNQLAKPKWGPLWYTPQFVLENANPGDNQQTRGIRVYPPPKDNKVYDLYVRYLREPTPIEVENPALEATLFSADPGYVTTAVDVDCEFYPDRHEEIVDRAVALYFKSSPDYQGFGQETAATKAGLT